MDSSGEREWDGVGQLYQGEQHSRERWREQYDNTGGVFSTPLRLNSMAISCRSKHCPLLDTRMHQAHVFIATLTHTCRLLEMKRSFSDASITSTSLLSAILYWWKGLQLAHSPQPLCTPSPSLRAAAAAGTSSLSFKQAALRDKRRELNVDNR